MSVDNISPEEIRTSYDVTRKVKEKISLEIMPKDSGGSIVIPRENNNQQIQEIKKLPGKNKVIMCKSNL